MHTAPIARIATHGVMTALSATVIAVKKAPLETVMLVPVRSDDRGGPHGQGADGGAEGH